MKRRPGRNKPRPSGLRGLARPRAGTLGVFAGTTAAALLAATCPVTVTVTLNPQTGPVVVSRDSGLTQPDAGQVRPECPL
ncbi:hypothetical protein [Streptomyces sp. NPDC001388]|uniref:hypothetical protein n=1 Tax=unclassified Streptomyces TaxID=2593676 RepID=UPI00367B5940